MGRQGDGIERAEDPTQKVPPSVAGHGSSTFLLPVLPFPEELRPRMCSQGPRTLPGTRLQLPVPVLILSLCKQD